MESASLRPLPVDLSHLLDAFECGAYDGVQWYLHTETGELVLLSEDWSFGARELLDDLPADTDPDDPSLRERVAALGLPAWEVDTLLQGIRIRLDRGGHYVAVPLQESREGYRDMQRFIATVQNEELRYQLEDAICGAKAFRRLKSVLGRHPTLFTAWNAFQAERKSERLWRWLHSLGVGPVT